MYGKKRRGELDSITKNAAGEYIYTGAWYAYTGKRDRKRELTALWIWHGLGAAAVLAAGCLSAPGMSGGWYMLLPYIICVVAAASAIWSLAQLSAAGEPIREYVFDTACKRLPLRGLVTAASACLAIIGEAVFLLLNGAGGQAYAAAAFMALMLLGGAAFLLGRRAAARMGWEKVNKKFE